MAHDLPPDQISLYAPFVPDQPKPHNGIATTNGTASAARLGVTEHMPIPQPSPPSEPSLRPEPSLPPEVTLPPELSFPPELSLPPEPQPTEAPTRAAEPEADPAVPTRRRRATKRRLPTQKIFSDLATQAAIPANAYAIGEDVDGAMCLVRTDEGFEVFNAAGGARHEVRVFQDEESAYFYLFGVLVAESVRTGALVPRD